MKRTITLISILATLTACSPAEKADETKITNAFRGALQDRSSASAGEHLFVEKCGMCHRQMGMGTVILARRMDPKVAMLETRTDLDGAMISSVARRGLGNMPRISRAEVSDAQLAQIVTYLTKEARRAPPN
jgi:mono/diheme cytochrome c family protein